MATESMLGASLSTARGNTVVASRIAELKLSLIASVRKAESPERPKIVTEAARNVAELRSSLKLEEKLLNPSSSAQKHLSLQPPKKERKWSFSRTKSVAPKELIKEETVLSKVLQQQKLDIEKANSKNSKSKKEKENKKKSKREKVKDPKCDPKRNSISLEVGRKSAPSPVEKPNMLRQRSMSNPELRMLEIEVEGIDVEKYSFKSRDQFLSKLPIRVILKVTSPHL